MEERTPKGDSTQEDNPEISQPQGHTVEVKEGLPQAMLDLFSLRQKYHKLEQRMGQYHEDTDGKMHDIISSLSDLKETLSGALSTVKEVNTRQRQMQKDLEHCHSRLLWDQQKRRLKSSHAEDHSCFTSQGERQRASLELLESERVYVSHLSLLIKANITFNKSDILPPKDKRPFPSSLRFLIQQHLQLLQLLQQRVLNQHWLGIVGDVLLRLVSKESNFLEYYATYLKELPKCLSVINLYIFTSPKLASIYKESAAEDENHLPLKALLLKPVQRISEYLLLLQDLLKATGKEHPDHYLLQKCVDRFKAFTCDFSPLLQHNQQLLKGGEESTIKQEKNTHMEHQYWSLQDEIQSSVKTEDLPHTSLEQIENSHSDEENEGLLEFPMPLDDMNESPSEDRDSTHSVMSLETLSTASSDSSPEIVFISYRNSPLREPKSKGTQDMSQIYPRSKKTRHHPVQWKSRSLNGLLSDGNSSDSLENTSNTLHEDQLAELEKQASLESSGGNLQENVCPPQLQEDDHNKLDLQVKCNMPITPSTNCLAKVSEAKLLSSDDHGDQMLKAESGLRNEEEIGEPYDRTRKQDQKSGFRSSFKRFFKKK